MKLKVLLTQLATLVLAAFATAGVHFNLHSLIKIYTVGDAMATAFSFMPGMLIGYAGTYVERLAGKDSPTPSLAAAICLIFFLIGLFRAVTLLFKFSHLSEWTRVPLDGLVAFFNVFT